MSRNRIWPAILIMLLAAGGFAFAAEEVVSATDDEVTSPYLIPSSRVSPSYPPAALAARFEGAVTFTAKVLKDGSVAKIDVLESTRPNLGFEQAIERAAMQWRFEPGTLNGEPVDTYATVRMQFRAPGTRKEPNGYVTAGFMGPQLGSPLAPPPGPPPAAHFQPTAFQGDQPRTPGNIPCQSVGCMYDRRDLFKAPEEGPQQPR